MQKALSLGPLGLALKEEISSATNSGNRAGNYSKEEIEVLKYTHFIVYLFSTNYVLLHSAFLSNNLF